LELRPRSTGEIVDDAWRMALADAPLLLTLSGLFTVPAAVLLLLLLTRPAPRTTLEAVLLPALVAVALPLTGLASGACQAVFRRRTEGKPADLAGCLAEALGRGPGHVFLRGLTLMAILLGGAVLLMPGLAIWAGTATVHALYAAGEARWTAAIKTGSQQTQRNATRAGIVTISRLAILLVAVLNLHAVLRFVLWVADDLAGFDLSYLGFVLTLGNPVYFASLAIFAWLLLVPFAEACNYLLYVDARTRYEGLDLWFRVRKHFRTSPIPTESIPWAQPVAVSALLLLLLIPASAAAADPRLDAVRSARHELARITKEVQDASPFRGIAPWNDRLQEIGRRLDRDGSDQRGRFVWYGRALTQFTGLAKEDAVKLLQGIDSRLELIEEGLAVLGEAGPGLSGDELRSLLRPSPDGEGKVEKRRPEQPEEKVVRDDNRVAREPRRPREGMVRSQPDGGFDSRTWMLLIGLMVAVVAIGFFLQRGRKGPAAPAAKAEQAKPDELSLEALLARTEAAPTQTLWRQADELARAGRHLDAARALYLALLAHLHRASLIRYGPTRTNGEYLDQLRRAQPVLQPPFSRLTGLFELKWFGERSCRPDDYSACRELAEEIRQSVAA